MKAFRLGLVLAGTAAVLASGCTVGPDYHEPDVTVPAGWSEPAQGGLTVEQVEATRWWEGFGDPVLNSLIERAVNANCDLRMAEARLRQARAERQAAAADFWPLGNASASFTRQKISGNTTIAGLAGGFTGGAGGGGAPAQQAGGSTGSLPSGFPLQSDLYQAGFDAAWEIDVFGGKRRTLEAANANLAAGESAWRGTLVSLLAEVARDYVELRDLQERLGIARKTVASQQETLEITQQRFKGGLAGDLDVAQASALLAGTQARVPALQTSVRQTMHRLATLLGQPPGALTEELSQEALVPATPPSVPVGLPSDLLRRRPDVNQAERMLASATAQIGAQTAELFPKFSLTGSAGLESAETGSFLSSGSRYWTLGSILRWRLFDAGRIRAQIGVRTAVQEEALAAYEKTVLTALQDVEDAMVAYSNEQARRDSLQKQVEAARRALGIANDRYVRGVGPFLDVLSSQSTLYEAEDRLSQSRRDLCTGLISLYKALGGGWDAFQPPAAAPATATSGEG